MANRIALNFDAQARYSNPPGGTGPAYFLAISLALFRFPAVRGLGLATGHLLSLLSLLSVREDGVNDRFLEKHFPLLHLDRVAPRYLSRRQGLRLLLHGAPGEETLTTIIVFRPAEVVHLSSDRFGLRVFVLDVPYSETEKTFGVE